MPSNDILLTMDQSIAIITINKPERYNAWTRGMRHELADRLKELANDDAVKGLVFTGAGDKAFCAGQDFTESQDFGDDATSRAWLFEIRDLYDLIRRIEKPTVAALNGIAAGSGFQLALLMDFRIAHDGVTMGQPEINSGIPSVVGPWVMSERITLTQVIDLALTGRMIDCEEALRMTLVNKVVPAGDVLATAIALARDIASKPPTALRQTKRAFRLSTQARFDLAFEIAEEAQVAAFASGEPQQCMEEFLRVRQSRKTARQ